MDDQKLKEYFKFDEADLAANRKGRLSEKQVKSLLAETKLKRDSTAWVIGILFLIIAIFGMVVGWASELRNPTTLVQIAIGLIFGVIWPLMWGRMGYLVIMPPKPKKQPRAKAERGSITIVKHEARDSVPYFELHIGKLQFDMDDDPTDILTQKGQYAVYYLQKENRILSVEPVSNPK